MTELLSASGSGILKSIGGNQKVDRLRLVGPERRGVNSLPIVGLNSRGRVNSGVGLRFGSEPGADRGPRAGSPCGVVDATGS
jgi:hypothetical protein